MEKEYFVSNGKRLIQENRLEFLLKEEIEPILIKLDQKSAGEIIGKDSYDFLKGKHNQLCHALARLNSLKEKELSNVLAQKEIDIEYAKLRETCLYLIDQLSSVEDFFQLSRYEKTNKIFEIGVSSPERNKSKIKFPDNQRLFSNLKIIESLGRIYEDQYPIIGIFEIGGENEGMRSIQTKTIIALWEELGRIEQNFDVSKNILPNSFKFKGTKISCIQDFNEEQISYLKEEGLGISIGVIQINVEKIPHINSLLFLKLYSFYLRIPLIFVFTYMDSPEMVNRAEALLKEYGYQMEQLGGSYQCQEVSLRTGEGLNELIQKIFFEIEMIEMKIE